MEQTTKPLWSLGCSALAFLMVMMCAEDAIASRRSFGRHGLHAHPTRPHHLHHRHDGRGRYQYSYRHDGRGRYRYRHYHRHYPDSFFSFRFHYGYPFWPYAYNPYYYGPGYVTPYSPGMRQRFPDFRHPGFFSYPGTLGKVEGDTQRNEPVEENQISKPDEMDVEPPP